MTAKHVDVVWTCNGWEPAIPFFQDALDKTLPKDYKAKVRVAEKRKDGAPDPASLNGADVIVTLANLFGDKELKAAGSNLKLIYQPATGIENLDIERINKAGIPVCNAPGQNFVETAEGTVMLILALARKLPKALEVIKERKLGEPSGIALAGKKLGIIGHGRIGRQVERMCKEGFGMKTSWVDKDETREEVEDLLRTSDIISIHTPLTPSTKNMISEKEFSLMKKGALVVNAARGGVVSKEATRKALESGHIGGYASDTFWNEPVDPNDDFLKLPNVIVTPHFCNSTEEYFIRIAQICADNTLSVLEGNEAELKHRVNAPEE